MRPGPPLVTGGRSAIPGNGSYRDAVRSAAVPDSAPEAVSSVKEPTVSDEKVYFTEAVPFPAPAERVSSGMPPAAPWDRNIWFSSGSDDVVKLMRSGSPGACWEIRKVVSSADDVPGVAA